MAQFENNDILQRTSTKQQQDQGSRSERAFDYGVRLRAKMSQKLDNIRNSIKDSVRSAEDAVEDAVRSAKLGYVGFKEERLSGDIEKSQRKLAVSEGKLSAGEEIKNGET